MLVSQKKTVYYIGRWLWCLKVTRKMPETIFMWLILMIYNAAYKRKYSSVIKSDHPAKNKDMYYKATIKYDTK